MSVKSLMIHRCDVYHLDTSATTGAYGIPSAHQQPKHSYPATPDITAVRCYFERRDVSNGFNRAEPYTTTSEMYTVFFPKGTDVRINDKAVWNGIAYKLMQPESVRGHHIECIAERLVEPL